MLMSIWCLGDVRAFIHVSNTVNFVDNLYSTYNTTISFSLWQYGRHRNCYCRSYIKSNIRIHWNDNLNISEDKDADSLFHNIKGGAQRDQNSYILVDCVCLGCARATAASTYMRSLCSCLQRKGISFVFFSLSLIIFLLLFFYCFAIFGSKDIT